LEEEEEIEDLEIYFIMKTVVMDSITEKDIKEYIIQILIIKI